MLLDDMLVQKPKHHAFEYKTRRGKVRRSMATKNALKLKLLIDTRENKVLFAEAGKDVVDFLFSLLALPIGTTIKILTEESMVGCISNLYKSIESLDQTYIVPNQNKSSLLSPKANASNTLFLTEEKNKPEAAVRKYYRCSTTTIYDLFGYSDQCRKHISNVKCTSCPSCSRPMVQEIQCIGSETSPENISSANGFVTGSVTYTVMDDLTVMPATSTISGIIMLNKFQVMGITALQEKIVELELQQVTEYFNVFNFLLLLQNVIYIKTVHVKNQRCDSWVHVSSV